MFGQTDRLGHVHGVVTQRVGHRVRHHDQRGTMDRAPNIGVLAEYAVDDFTVADIALVEDPIGGELGPSGDKAVEYHRSYPALREGGGDRTADKTGSTRYQYLHHFPPESHESPYRATV